MGLTDHLMKSKILQFVKYIKDHEISQGEV